MYEILHDKTNFDSTNKRTSHITAAKTEVASTENQEQEPQVTEHGRQGSSRFSILKTRGTRK